MSRSRSHRVSTASDSSSCSSPERGELDDDEYALVHQNDSQSSLSVSLEDMDLDQVEYERQRRVSPISRLPAELLIAVFSKLSSPSDIQNCMLVSKLWARNSVDLLWHRPSTNRWKNLVNVIQTARKKDGFFAYHDLIKRLNLGQLKNEVSDGTLHPLAICKRIERLTLPGCSQLSDASLVPVIEGNRALMAIDVSDLDMITDRSMYAIAKNCYRLQGLNISGCRGVTDDSLVAIARNCRRLKRLKLNDCSQITDFAVMAFADHCHDILEIDLFRCSNITDMSVTALITEGRQLRELRLSQCVRITDEAFLQLPQDMHFDALRILDLTDCNELQDAGLHKIVQAAPRLRNLVLAKCRNITDRGVLAITRLGKNLHFLHLGHCANITDYGVSHLVKYCNRIRYIDFSCCANLTDTSVSLLATLPKLKRIGLVKCSNITDASICALARPKPSSGGYHPNNLERLHLSYCSNLTISGIRTLLINCPQLTHLSLTGVQPFLREDLLRFCRDAPSEFNDHQRDVFCVFSGSGVNDLRFHLQESYPTPPGSEAGSDDEMSNVPYTTMPAPHRFTGELPPASNPIQIRQLPYHFLGQPPAQQMWNHAQFQPRHAPQHNPHVIHHANSYPMPNFNPAMGHHLLHHQGSAPGNGPFQVTQYLPTAQAGTLPGHDMADQAPVQMTPHLQNAMAHAASFDATMAAAGGPSNQTPTQNSFLLANHQLPAPPPPPPPPPPPHVHLNAQGHPEVPLALPFGEQDVDEDLGNDNEFN